MLECHQGDANKEINLKTLAEFAVQCVKVDCLDDADALKKVLEDQFDGQVELLLKFFKKYILAFVKYHNWQNTSIGRSFYRSLLEEYHNLAQNENLDKELKAQILAKISYAVADINNVEKVLAGLEISKDFIQTSPEVAARLFRLYGAHFMQFTSINNQKILNDKNAVITNEILALIDQLESNTLKAKTLLQIAVRVIAKHGENACCLIKKALKLVSDPKAQNKEIASLAPLIARLVIMIRKSNPQLASKLSLYLVAEKVQSDQKPKYTVLPMVAYRLVPQKVLTETLVNV